MKYRRSELRYEGEIAGEPVFAYQKIRPRLYWQALRLWLFLSIVWREWEPGQNRISIRLAWSVATGVYERVL